MKRIGHRILLLSVAALLSGGLWAQTYPSRTLRVLVGYPAGGGADFAAGVAADGLTKRLGQSVVVENKPGANSIIAHETVARAPADGYTLLLGLTAANVVNPNVYKSLPYDAVKDFAPVSRIGNSDFILVTSPSFPAKTVPELIAMAKKAPDAVNFASGGSASVAHLAAELFLYEARVKMTHIPFKGSSPAITALMSNDVALYFDSIASSMPHVNGGKIRAMAVTGQKRSPDLPNVPTIAETLPGFEVTTWYGIMAPAGTPGDIIAKLNRELVQSLNEPATKARLASQGVTVIADTPEQFRAALLADIDKWGTVTRAANIVIKE